MHMAAEASAYPLTRLLTALAHSPELLKAFRDDPRAVASDSGVVNDAHLDALASGDLAAIQNAVNEELQGTDADATVGYWITVEEKTRAVAMKVPDWWIRHF